ncbi:DUF6287 domain-containing protein [Streptococcus infantis]|uniref:DUF6287 domain-containing protein n=1 Tax=Streptococcus infantis TaxID=68892 RepID=UPI001CBDFA0F|nr:DUF6287 domain-containing protein [Streptococcus infantis]MBZ2119426.1 hypothetical protein [Streptococcus infantis]MBZ2121202.1 hypothetical protein [Streptococcus infantis]MBZ2124976.1 hypothetical protein [Streptococcus infantis]
MKKNAILYIGVVLILAIFLLLSIFINRKESKPQEVQSTTTDVIKSDFEDISGDYISSTGEKATVAKNNQNWRISYNTDEGNVFGDFSTDWKEDGNNSSSVTEFNKSDGNKDFKISILINNNVDDSSKILKVITLSDGNKNHEMVFASSSDYFKNSKDNIFEGDLSAFEGTYSNDYLEKAIAESNFTLYGYKREDYYEGITSVFPRLSYQDGNWIFWSGSMHAQFKLDKSKKPKKINDYYEVYFVGDNRNAIIGQELVLTFIPANETGPDNNKTQENRILYGKSYLRPYRVDWWKLYQHKSLSEVDLDIEAIENGDISTLVGTWRNGRGNELIINSDGTTGDGNRIKVIKNSSKKSGVPSVSLQSGHTSAAIGLFRIGFKNPMGDQSDSSRPRLIITQTAGNYNADFYYYRVEESDSQ